MANLKVCLLDIFEDLDDREFKKFQWQLHTNKGGVKKATLDNADREQTVDAMVGTYVGDEVLEVTKRILEKIRKNDLVQKLSNSGSDSGSKGPGPAKRKADSELEEPTEKKKAQPKEAKPKKAISKKKTAPEGSHKKLQPHTSPAKPPSTRLKKKNIKIKTEGFVSLQGLITSMTIQEKIDEQGPYLLQKLKLDGVEGEVALWREAAKPNVAEGMSVKISHLKRELKPRYGLTFNSTRVTNVEVLSATGKRGRKKKDPNEPKRPASAFFLFSSERRPSVKEQHPGLSFGDYAKKLGEMWSALPQSDKQPYEEQAQKLKEKYDMYSRKLMRERSELCEKKQRMSMEMKQSGQMEMKYMDQTSTPPLPPGDKLSQSSSMMTEGQTYTPASVSSSTDLSSQHVQTGSSMTSQREVKMEDEEGEAEEESKKVKGQPDVKMEDKPEGTIPLHGEMEDHPVTESLSSPHPSLELQDETDLSRCFSGFRIEESISLPRSHSLPSLRQIPCIENKPSFRAKRAHSLNDVTLLDKTQKITPDIIVVENKESYRFHCTQAGLFQCSVTGLVFKMVAEGDVIYRTVPWDRRLLSQLDKRPAGPLFDLKSQTVCQLHFPHCEILSMGGGKSLSVLHVRDDGRIELIYPAVITETHVIINVNGFSPYGLVNDVDITKQASVSLFYTPPIDDDDPISTLKVLLLPGNVVLEEVQTRRRKLVGEEIYIEKHPCKLIPNQEYTLSVSPEDDSIIIEPDEAIFEVNESSYHNYLPTFEVILEGKFRRVRLLLRDSNQSICVWKGYVDLSTPALRRQQVQRTLTLPTEKRLLTSSVRDSFIDSVSLPNLNCLLDKLFKKQVLTDDEREKGAEIQAKKDKARFVIDTVRHKGPVASSSMIMILCDLDTCLSKHLGLM